MNIQMYFSLIELCLFCSQIIVSQMLFLNRSLSYHKYKQSHVQVSVEQDLHWLTILSLNKYTFT